MRLIQVVFLAFVLIAGMAGLAGGATVTFAPNAAGYGSQTRAICFAFVDTDIGTPSIASRAIYGEVQRIVIEATGTETDWTLTLTDAHGVTLFTKTDLTSASVPYSYAMGLSSVDGKSVAGIPTHGPLTVEINDVNYAAEVQTLTSTPNATDGTFTLTYAGKTTAAIAHDANLAEIRAALEALPNVDVNDINVSGVDLANTGATVFTFADALGDVDPLTINLTALRGVTAEVQTLTIGANAIGGTFTLAYDGNTTEAIAYDANVAEIKAALEALPTVDVNDVNVGGNTLAAGGATTFTFASALGDVNSLTIDLTALGKTAEVQTLTSTPNATGGTFTLTYGGKTTAAIAYDANVAEIKAALEALSTVEVNDVNVAGQTLAATGDTTFTFRAGLGDVAMLSIDIDELTGPNEVSVAETVKGALVTGSFAETTKGASVAGSFAETVKGGTDLPTVDVTVYFKGDY